MLRFGLPRLTRRRALAPFSRGFTSKSRSPLCHAAASAASATATTFNASSWDWDAEGQELNLNWVNPSGIFPNSELDMTDIDWVGFDYDYTIAGYSNALLDAIYNLAKERLVVHNRYPDSIAALKYDPDFAIRGLYFDVQRGFLIKPDAVHQLQYGNAYFGRRVLSKEEIVAHYHGTHISSLEEKNLRAMADLFCLPEICLISDVIQHFVDSHQPFDPAYVYEDVRKAVEHCHVSGKLHQLIATDPGSYLLPSPQLANLLTQLRSAGKKLFLLTNSPYSFINAGLTHMLKSSLPPGLVSWRDLFDVIITSGDKPSFYGSAKRPFRSLNAITGKVRWFRVDALLPGQVYTEGSLAELNRLTKNSLAGPKVLYIGDHLFADLHQPARVSGWRTGAIIKEVETEINVQNTPRYRNMLAKVLRIEKLLRGKVNRSGVTASAAETEELRAERQAARFAMRVMYNKNWGSVFRTHGGPTLYGRACQRYSDVYTSRLENLLNYPPNHAFYPERAYLPHELRLPAD